MSAEDEARSKGDDHHRDVVELARAIGTAVEDDRGGENEHADRECDARLGHSHALITDRAMEEIRYLSLPVFVP